MKVLLAARTSVFFDSIRDVRSGSLLLHGASSMGKRLAALELARLASCGGDEQGLCHNCTQIAAATYPDLILIGPGERPSISIEQIRALKQQLVFGAYYKGGRRFVVIDSAHAMTIEAQNAMLKLLEEPPTDTLIILVSDQPDNLLTTVKSRVMQIYFEPVPAEQIQNFLVGSMHTVPARAKILAEAAKGSPGAAILAVEAEGQSAASELEQLSDKIATMTRFDRLVMAGQIGDSLSSATRLAGTMHARLVAAITSGSLPPADATGSFNALEKFRARITLKVSPKVALECLMLEY